MTQSVYITQDDLENRLSAYVVKQIFDDDEDGTADTGPIAQILADANGKVEGYLQLIFPLPITGTIPNEVKRLALDVATAYARQRHPEYVRGDWEKLMKWAEKGLENLRDGFTELDVPVGEAPIKGGNRGGIVHDSGPRYTVEGLDGSAGGGDF